MNKRGEKYNAMARAPMPLLSSGHRPFFLMMAAYGAGALGFWILGYRGFSPLDSTWHGHEMIFGFAVAAMAGFLLTAAPNWTGRPPVRGAELLFLVALWAGGRLAVNAGAFVWFDLIFLPVLAARLLYDIIASQNWRNLMVPVILFALAGLNLFYHFADPSSALRVGAYLITGLIALIGGRIVPAFTANALGIKHPPAKAPRLRNSIDLLSVPAILVLVAAELYSPGSVLTGALALLAAFILLIRMAWWRTFQTLRNPLIWVLHIGYIWIPIGYVLKGLSDIWLIFDPSSALHALTVGGIGVMVLAVSSRASLGHSGRPLKADVNTTAVYCLVTAAALTRVFWPRDLYGVEISGALWLLGFGLYTIAYWPILTKPRIDITHAS